MTLRTLAIALAAAALALPAAAQLDKSKSAAVRLKADEVKKALFGTDMRGFSPADGLSWRECVDPKGETLYETDEFVLKGRVNVTPEGYACYAYEDTGYKESYCFRMLKTKDGFRFEGEFGSTFITQRVVTGVTNCKPNNLVS